MTPDREPECGRDFCDRCGDCLVCYADDPCYEMPSDEEDRPHLWVVYGDDKVLWAVNYPTFGSLGSPRADAPKSANPSTGKT